MKSVVTTLGVLLALVTTAYAADMEQGAAESQTAAESQAAETQDQAADTAAAKQEPAEINGTVARAAVTSGIEDREPVDGLTSANTNTEKLYYFTEIRGMEGQTVTHRWEHNGEVMAEIPFEIGGPRWRVYSSKNLSPTWTGEWKVSVIDANGSTMSANTFTYDKAPAGSDTTQDQGAAAPDQPTDAPAEGQ